MTKNQSEIDTPVGRGRTVQEEIVHCIRYYLLDGTFDITDIKNRLNGSNAYLLAHAEANIIPEVRAMIIKSFDLTEYARMFDRDEPTIEEIKWVKDNVSDTKDFLSKVLQVKEMAKMVYGIESLISILKVLNKEKNP